MALWEVSLRARYDYPFIALSEEIPETPMSMWCIWDRELLQVPSRDPATLRAVEKAIRSAGRVVAQWVDAQSARLFLLQCTCDRLDSIWNIVEANQCMDAPPVVYRDGWSYFRVLSLDESRTRTLFKDFGRRGTAELIRKRELPLSVLPSSIWANTLFGGQTKKQADALLTAQRFGYYVSPRRVTTEQIATSVGLSRTTFEEHLRKAENRVIEALVPYLQLFATADHPADRLPLRETPTEPTAPAS